MVVDNLILIGCHLSSKKVKN